MTKPKSGSDKSGKDQKSGKFIPVKDRSKHIGSVVDKSGKKGTNSGGPRKEK